MKDEELQRMPSNIIRTLFSDGSFALGARTASLQHCGIVAQHRRKTGTPRQNGNDS